MKFEAIAAMVVTAALGAISIFGQTIARTARRADLVMEAATPVRGELLREIDDPNTGARWLLFADEARSGGPGRLVLAAGSKANLATALAAATQKTSATDDIVIRTGDALIMEEHSPVVDARLQAVALGSAAPGDAFRVRLTIGGKVVRVVAIAAGRAAFAPEDGVGR